MSNQQSSPAARGAADIHLDDEVAATLRSLLPRVAKETVTAVTAEVPGYAGALTGEMGENIKGAVEMALGGFLKLAEQSTGSDPSTPLGPALEAAYALGRGEARSGRSMDALLAAYRVGARVSWREFSAAAVTAGMSAATMAQFAELVFAYIDELSAASVSGHADELATTGRVRQRYLERLSLNLLAGAPADVLTAGAARAEWREPRTLTAVILPSDQSRGVLSLLDSGTLQPADESSDLEPDEETTVLLVPDMDGSQRGQLLRLFRARSAVVGPARPWTQVRASYQRALRAVRMGLTTQDQTPVDTELHLVELVLGADAEALADLRTNALTPLAELRPATAEKLAETLRSWLVHHGRRDEVAADLHVHAQTVRYRMGQLRELYGDTLTDPQAVLELTIALSRPTPPPEYSEENDG